ncbi:T9SS type A sorting domain-containing protein [Cognataquiflexum nitidum]|uniref:T9SS type A sorting domain-containing protein n=1 Tax=Cognataquiflexum nitidum TaxID=2922272 RepID=UPI00210475FA|nr:T9SS type A sorting domain-containing protein [Cognataquiflexum nitidum]
MIIFLNLSDGIFQINLSQSVTEIPVFDAMRKSVFHQQVETHEAFIDLSRLPSGVFFLQAWNGREVVGKKVVVESWDWKV